MADKNPKHPMKKKKVAPKINATRNTASQADDIAPKSKKHTY